MERTPPRKDNQEDGGNSVKTAEDINYPSGKLSALSRKANEVRSYLSNPSCLDKAFVDNMYREYKIKCANLLEACEVEASKENISLESKDKFENWQKSAKNEMAKVKDMFANWYESQGNYDDLKLGDSASRISNQSGKSSSSLRAKLAEQRAKRMAEQTFLAKKEELEQTRLQCEKKLRELELQKSIEIENNLEKELHVLESGSQLCNRSDYSYKRSNEQEWHKQPEDYKLSRKDASWDHFNEAISKQNDISLMLAHSQERAMLPKNEPEVFDGSDLTAFRRFVQTFQQTIESRCDNDMDKLYFLEKYTSGGPRDIVRSCFGYNPVQGYEKALSLLRKRYGNDYKIAESYLQKVNNWLPIKNEDGGSLEELSIFLMSCANSMHDVTSLNQLNSPKEIMSIVRKLPYKLRDKWRSKSHHLMESGKEVKFQDLVNFIEKEASILNFPVFGDIQDHLGEKSSKSIHAVGKKRSFAMQLNDSRDCKVEKSDCSCLFCKKTNHKLNDCFLFAKDSSEDRLNFVKENNLCFACLQKGHSSKGCTQRLKCSNCGGRHPTALHRDTQKAETTEAQNEVAGSKMLCTAKSNNLSIHTGTGEVQKVICAALPVKLRIKGTKEYIYTYMGLDNFSTDCFMSNELLNKLGVCSSEVQISLTTMENVGSRVSAQVINNVEVCDLDENERSVIPVVYSNIGWPFSYKDTPTPADIENYSYLHDVPFRYINENIGILVGINEPDILRPLEVVGGGPGQPFATLYKFGWALNGPIISRSGKESSCHNIDVENQNNIADKIEKLYSQEFCDSHEDELGPSQENLLWRKRVSSSLQKLDCGQYEIALPFREENVCFPSNRSQVLSRLYGCRRRMKNNSKFHKDYSLFIDSMLKMNFAEVVPVKEENAELGKVWYLAHHGIYHKQKQKLRVVFDCSLKFQGTSLNSQLLQGPDLTNSLLGVLLRFRQEEIAFVGDIEKMFYRVKVPKKHSDYMRFWWYPEGNLEEEPRQYRLTVHVFGAISSPSCANYALKQTILDANAEFSEIAKSTINRNFYVDDLLRSVSTAADASELLREVCELLKQGGFRLTGFISNSRSVLMSVPKEKLAGDLKNVDLFKEDLPNERALGVKWNVQEDVLGFRLNFGTHPLTRRGILSAIFSIYDPFGFAIPAILPAKQLFQQACIGKLGWDAELPAPMLRSWRTWLSDIPLLQNFNIPRSYGVFSCNRSVQLHVFCDGSEVAFGAVAYLRTESFDGKYNCTLVMAKSRLTPASGSTFKTIPRIELSAARLAITIQQIIKREVDLNIDSEWFWTDSVTVLKYITNDTKRFQRFVSNRITFIRSHSRPDQWRHVPGKLNPADVASRGCSVAEFLSMESWKHGPRFLFSSEEHWPCDMVDRSLEINDPEMKKSTVVAFTKQDEDSPTKRLLESSSNWYVTKVRVAWMLRVKLGLSRGQWNTSSLSLEELEASEREIWKFIQQEEYPKTIEMLKAKKNLLKRDSLLKLNPFVDGNGVLRVGGRISRAAVSYDSKHPIILPKDSHVVKIIVRLTHQKVGHLAKSAMLADLRQKFWIVKGSALVKRVVRDCIICRKQHGRPVEQIMADLPLERVNADLRPFTNVGVDFFGPFYVSRGRGRASDKRYRVIFTCLSSRAVHLEVANSLDTDSFLNALRRFMSRRGDVKVIRSDNGTNFVGGNRELQEMVNRWNVASDSWLKQRGIEWKFQPPAASHFGGVWEREIRTIRQVLNSLISEQVMKMSDERLNTLLCKVENILNGRPLTELSSDPNDLETLTPNHLLLLHSGITFPPGLFDENDLYAKQRWRQVQYLADLFWTRWRKEYLPLLQERQKWTFNRESVRVGDLVLIIDQLLPRNQWCTGRVTEVMEDKHKRVRAAKVLVAKLKNSDKLKVAGRTIIERPITKLILLRSVKEL